MKLKCKSCGASYYLPAVIPLSEIQGEGPFCLECEKLYELGKLIVESEELKVSDEELL